MEICAATAFSLRELQTTTGTVAYLASFEKALLPPLSG
jgi:hypothetical protein